MTVILLNYYNNNKLSSKIAGFDLDWTIIKTKSGNVFPTSKNDWQFLFEEIPEKLKSLSDYTIVIFSNQMGISKGKVKKEDILYKIGKIYDKLQIPFIFSASTEDDINRKPRTGMFTQVQMLIDKPIDKENSFYVGDMAGRKNDKEDTDRKFALNLGIKFYTPEEYFLNNSPENFKLGGYLLDYNVKKETKIKLTNEKELILLCGYPGSGKSTLAKKLINNSPNYKFYSRDLNGAKYIKLIESSMKEKEPVIVEGLFATNKSRNQILDLANKFGYKKRLIQLDVPMEFAYHLNIWRSFVSLTKKIPILVYKRYDKEYEQPIEDDWDSIETYKPKLLDADVNRIYLF